MGSRQRLHSCGFFFFIFKKIKFQKYMSVLKYFKNIPRSPSHRATGLMCNFFFQICNEVPGEKKTSPVARWGATGACRPAHGRSPLGPAHSRGRGPVAPPRATRGLPPYKSPSPPLPSSCEPENSTKNPEKKERSEEKESGEALPDSALVICRLVHLV